MKKMLFIDDRTKRIHSALKKYSKDFEVTIACNFLEAMRCINTEDYDVISFDCDLGGKDYVDLDSPDSIMQFVRYLKQCGGWPEGKKRPAYILVHSSNVFARSQFKIEMRELGFDKIYTERFEYE